MLLRHVDGVGVGLLGQGAFKSGRRSKGPARTTVSLIFDWAHEAIGCVIDSCSTVSQVAAIALSLTTHSAQKAVGAAIVTTFVATAVAIAIAVVAITITSFELSFLGIGDFGVQTEEVKVLLRFQVSGPVDGEAESSWALACLLVVMVINFILVLVVAVLLSFEIAKVTHILVVF